MGLFPKEYQAEIDRDSIYGVQNAANKFQWALVNGLDANPDVHVHICNSLYIGSYPKRYKKKKIPTFEFHHTEGANDINVGFCNWSIVKYFSKYKGIKSEIDRWASVPEQPKVLLAYAMAFPFVQVLKYVKRRYCDFTVCLVVPDLPEYMNAAASDNVLYIWAKKIQKKIIQNCITEVDCFVLLTEQMKEWFGREICYTVLEGIAASTVMEAMPSASGKKKSILYAGMIEEKYGVIDMAEAFMRIPDPDWMLEIFGDGTSLNKIRQMVKDDVRIRVHGSVPNETVVRAQREASLLVNPRRNNQAFTKYSFPSKIIEYMSSGTPVLAYKLDGMPEEYATYFYRIEETDDGMFEALKRIIYLPEDERLKMGARARDFIIQNKNARKQCEKVLALIKECING
jgi:glycosyltransferase involved in cell wall biosynthesis